jgi:NTE family protein
MSKEFLTKLKNARRLGIAFGGGGARGIAHIGVLKALEAHCIIPAVASGTSFGAIIGALFCNGYKSDEMLEIIKNTKWHNVIDFSVSGGIIKGEALGKHLSKFLPLTFEELKKPLSIVTVNIETGAEVILSKGELIPAIRASSSFPGMFKPVTYLGMKLVDGGIVNNVPVSALYQFAVDRSIAINVIGSMDSSGKNEKNDAWRKVKSKLKIKRTSSFMEVMHGSLDMMLDVVTRINLAVHKPDLYIEVPLPGIKIFQFDGFDEIYQKGLKAGDSALK